MDVRLKPEVETKLSRIAAERGRATESLIEEAVQRFLEHDDWFRGEVEKGLKDLEEGRFIEDDEIRRMIEERYPG
jgi:predicted transcriptional regulator